MSSNLAVVDEEIYEATKKCSGCKRELPYSMFSKNKNTKTGLACYCKECKKKENGHYNKLGIKHEPIPNRESSGLLKECSTCHKILPLGQFNKMAKSPDGLDYVCVDCRKISKKAWSQAHPGVQKKYYKNAKEKDPDYLKHIREYTLYRRTEHPNAEIIANQIKENNLRYRLENPDKVREYEHNRNKGKVAAKGRNRRARLLGLSGTNTAEDIEEIYIEQLGKCVYCGQSLKNYFEIDHIIPVSRVGSSNYAYNLQLLCGPCNRSKGDKTHDEFLEYISQKEELEVKLLLKHWRI